MMVRREQDAGGAVPAGKAIEFCRELIDWLERESGFIDSASNSEAAGNSHNLRAGGILSRRTQPRRLDKRIVMRRPMMLTKKRSWGTPSTGKVAGREIIARN